MKRLKQLLLLALCLAGLTGCTSKPETDQVLSVSVGDTPVSLDPIYSETVGDQTVLNSLYENLMRAAPASDGGREVVSGMARSVSQDQNFDGTVKYTFKLRDASWSDGKKVTADDFVYAWRRLADPASQSPYAALLSVVSGYDEARQSGDMSLLQVEAKNSSTLVVTLSGRYDWFLTEVCTSPATVPLRQDVIQKLKDASKTDENFTSWWGNPTALVTNGPYVVREYDPEEMLVAGANLKYDWEKEGPTEIRFHFSEDADEAWAMYEDKEVDLVWPLPRKQVDKLAEKEKHAAVPELCTHAVLFNDRQEQLSDPTIRRAMHMVIDRNALAQAQGKTVFPAEGLVPPGVPENESADFRTAGGPELDNSPENAEKRVEDAKKLLEEAGYTMGPSQPPMEYLYVDENNNKAVAEAICKTWEETLDLWVTPVAMTELELWAAMREGDFQLAGVDLNAPGNDAECFLMQWTSDSRDNLVGYENSAYDTLMSIIATAGSETARMACLHDAEELLLSDDVVIPLYTESTGWLAEEPACPGLPLSPVCSR